MTIVAFGPKVSGASLIGMLRIVVVTSIATEQLMLQELGKNGAMVPQCLGSPLRPQTWRQVEVVEGGVDVEQASTLASGKQTSGEG